MRKNKSTEQLLIDSDGNIYEVWTPKGLVVTSESPGIPKNPRHYAPEGAPWPVLGQSKAELVTTQFVLDGTFESDEPADVAKVRELAKMAFAEYADRMDVSVEELEARARVS